MALYPRTRAFVEALDARRPSLAAELEEEVAEYRELSMAENDAVICGLARTGLEILRGRPDFEQAMAEQEPPAPDYEAIMARLRRKKSA